MKSHILVSNGSRIFVSTLLFITLIIGAILASTKTKANVVMNEVSLAVPVSCSMSSTISTGNEHTATIAPNAYTEDIGITDIKAICNDFSGFSIYAIGYTNNTDGNNTMLGTNTNQTIATGTNTTGTTSNWAMKLMKVENGTGGGSITYNPGNLSILNSYDSYHAVPDTLTKVAEYKAATGSSTTDQTLGSNIKTTYAAFMSSTQYADTYVGKVKYLLLHPATLVAGNYTIAYNANGGTGTMNSETNVKNYESHTLALNTFTAPTGYVFSGWCTVQDTNATSTNPQTTCDSESYRDGATISSSPSISATDGGTLTLYAYWQRPYTMQQFANGTADTTCTKLNIGERVTLIDARDNQEYTVAKLKDNKCWMTKNLNLAGGTALTAEDTDVTATYIDGFTTSNNLTKTNDAITLPASSTSGFSVDNYAYVYNTGNNTDTCTTPGCYSYYSWDAATLGSGRSISTDNIDAPYSICPKGWRLPTSRTTAATDWQTASDFYALAHQYGLDSTTSTSESDNGFYTSAGPNTTPNFLLAGFYVIGSFSNGNSGGYYWSSTSNSGDYARYLFFYPSYVYSANYGNRGGGFSVRCVTEESINDLTYMQDFAALSNDTKNRIINNMKTEETHTLKDKRDNQDYTIAKLKDGKVWMTENLNLAGGTALSAGDTDVTTAYINGFTTSNNLTKTGNTIVLPASATKNPNNNNLTDNTQFSDNSNAYVFNSGNETNCGASGQNTPCYSYYSWIAATLGGKQANGSTAQNGNGYNAAASICPKGWRLPTSTTSDASPTTNPNWKTGDWYALAMAYGANLDDHNYDDNSTTRANFYDNAGPGTIPNFLLASFYNGVSSPNLGRRGLYWSSTVGSVADINAYFLDNSLLGDVPTLYSAGVAYKRLGLSTRCLLRTD